MAAVRVFLMHVKYGLNVFPCAHRQTHSHPIQSDQKTNSHYLHIKLHIAFESSEKLPNSQASRLFGCIGGGKWHCKDDRKLGICSTWVLVVVVMVLTLKMISTKTTENCNLLSKQEGRELSKGEDISFGGGECTCYVDSGV